MSIAAPAGDCRPYHFHCEIPTFTDVLLRNGLPETGPAGAGVKLCIGVETCRIAANAAI